MQKPHLLGNKLLVKTQEESYAEDNPYNIKDVLLHSLQDFFQTID